MRLFNGLVGLLAGTGLCVVGSEILSGCSNDFRGCAETRTCTSGTGGSGGNAGAGDDAQAGSGETGGKATVGGSSAGSGAETAGGAAAGGKLGGAGKAGSNGTRDGGAGGEPDVPGGTAADNGGSPEGTAGDAAGGSTTTGADHTPPRVVITTPANEENGVVENPEIRITFSESMDEDSTKQAFQSSTLQPLSLTWSDHDKVLVVTLSEKLKYAEVTDPAEDPKHYSFTIKSTATDLAGNALGSDYNVGFNTLRHITQRLRLAKGRQVVRSTDGTETVSSTCTVDSTALFAGDDDHDAGWAFITAFDYATLAPDVVSWESARLSGQFARHTSKNPFSRLGSLTASRIVAPDLAQAKYGSGTALDFGTAASVLSAGAFDLDVVEGLRAAYANRATEGNRLVARFKFETTSNGDGEGEQIGAPCNQVALDVTYTAP